MPIIAHVMPVLRVGSIAAFVRDWQMRYGGRWQNLVVTDAPWTPAAVKVSASLFDVGVDCVSNPSLMAATLVADAAIVYDPPPSWQAVNWPCPVIEYRRHNVTDWLIARRRLSWTGPDAFPLYPDLEGLRKRIKLQPRPRDFVATVAYLTANPQTFNRQLVLHLLRELPKHRIRIITQAEDQEIDKALKDAGPAAISCRRELGLIAKVLERADVVIAPTVPFRLEMEAAAAAIPTISDTGIPQIVEAATAAARNRHALDPLSLRLRDLSSKNDLNLHAHKLITCLKDCGC